MSAKSFSTLAACLFSLMALGQFVRALRQVAVMAGHFAVPVGASWIAVLIFAGLAVLGFTAKRG